MTSKFDEDLENFETILNSKSIILVMFEATLAWKYKEMKTVVLELIKERTS